MTKTLAQILEENNWNGSHGTDKNTDHKYFKNNTLLEQKTFYDKF